MLKKISGGVVHKLPTDLKSALSKDSKALALWEKLTPLARNEWICWTTYVKKSETRQNHVGRLIKEIKEGAKRPCCWYGCIHRKDKKTAGWTKSIIVAKRKSF